MTRSDGRTPNELRPITITRKFTRYAEGSVLISAGNTMVLCTASVEDKVPPFLRDSGKGWLTAEYSLLPRSTHTRTTREASKGKIGGRTHEIQRLIGRSLRAAIDLNALGERTIHIDCDVLQADGGTRTAAITGSFVAVVDALKWMKEQGMIDQLPIREHLAAISVGIINGVPMLDLPYEEDSQAEVDMNVVQLESGRLVEVQATAEGAPYTRQELNQLLDLAEGGIRQLIEIQKNAING